MESLYSVKLGELIKQFKLEVIRGAAGYEDQPIRTEDVNRPGLQLTGFFDYFDPHRLQVIGKVEDTYLSGLTADQRRASFEQLLSQDIPALIISRGIDPYPECMEMAEKYDLSLIHIDVYKRQLFVLCLVAAFYFSNQCPYVYGYSQIHTVSQNEAQIASETINNTFGTQNTAALLVPRGDYESEKALLKRLSSYDEVESAIGLANIEAMDGYTLTDALTPRQFSELIDLDYEQAKLLYAAYAADKEEYGRIVEGVDDYTIPLMDLFLFIHDVKSDGYITLDDQMSGEIDDLYDQLTDARAQMLGENYSRLVLQLALPEEGEETFEFLKTIHAEAERYYDADQIFLVGNSTSDYDLSVSFAKDNILISVLTVVFVILVLLFTFLSVGLPILLILVIQGSIWINFAFPGLTGQPIFFMSYLIVTAIQMGANIDYAIVISSWYNELKGSMSRQQAIIKALSLAFPTVLTSGSILSVAAFLIGQITTEPSIVGIGQCLCRGTLISMFLVMFILPQLLLLGDKIVERTRFNLKFPDHERVTRTSGVIYVSGRVRGRVSGVIDANIHGVIRGELAAMVESGEASKEEEHETQE